MDSFAHLFIPPHSPAFNYSNRDSGYCGGEVCDEPSTGPSNFSHSAAIGSDSAGSVRSREWRRTAEIDGQLKELRAAPVTVLADSPLQFQVRVQVGPFVPEEIEVGC